MCVVSVPKSGLKTLHHKSAIIKYKTLSSSLSHTHTHMNKIIYSTVLHIHIGMVINKNRLTLKNFIFLHMFVCLFFSTHSRWRWSLNSSNTYFQNKSEKLSNYHHYYVIIYFESERNTINVNCWCRWCYSIFRLLLFLFLLMLFTALAKRIEQWQPNFNKIVRIICHSCTIRFIIHVLIFFYTLRGWEWNV